MRPHVREFVGVCSSVLEPKGPIYEFGSRQIQGKLSDLRPLFPNQTYVGCDLEEGRGVDRIEDLRRLNIASDTAGGVVCVDTLEHVEFCRQAIHEMRRILRPGGVLILASVMLFPIHHPPDYWRFTPEGFSSLLRPFGDQKHVWWAGRQGHPHTVASVAWKGPGSKERTALLNKLCQALGAWQIKSRTA